VSSTHWHTRLGHPTAPIVRRNLHRHELPVASNKFAETICDACQQGKSHQLPFSESSRVVKHPLELVFSDVWGPAQTSVNGHNYYISFIDAYSRFTWLYLIKHKSDVFDVFLQFQAHVEGLLQHKILHVQSDWGVNITTSIRFLISLRSRTMCLVLIHISRMALLNVSTIILWRLALLTCSWLRSVSVLE
jgi:hypothetical protein